MSIAGSLRDFIWRGEERARDPFASRSKSLWQTVADLDTFHQLQEEGFNIPQVYTACQIYGNAMASLDFRTFKDEGDVNIEQERHILTRLLTEQINPFMTPFDFIMTIMFHWGITGNGNAFIVRNRKGDAAELILLDPHNFTKVEIKNNRKLWHYANYPNPIPDEDMFHIAGPGWDGLLGKNPIEAHRTMMSTSLHMDKFVEKFFENGAHLRHIIEMEGQMDDDSYNNFMTSWHNVFSGPQNAGKTAILENGMKLKPLSLNPVDAAYLQFSGNVTKMVANIYRLPLYLFNEYKEGAQYDNVESQDLAFIKYAIGPMVIRWEQEIKRKLLPNNTRFFGKFDLFSLSRGDMKSISEYVKTFFILGALNQDEIRRKYLKMNPLPDGQGQRYYVQGNNMVPIDKIDQIYDQKLQGTTPGGGEHSELDTDLPTIKEKS